MKRGDRVLGNTGQKFRDYWKNGFEGERATQGDWQLHLNTLFPEVRLKRTIEVRGADSQNAANAPALAALFAGLFYDAPALDAARDLVAEYTFEEVEACRQRVPVEGLAAPLRGGSLVTLGERVMELAEAGLERRNLRDERGADERVHLAAMKARLARAECPADELLRVAERGGFDRASILAACTMPL